MTMILVTPDMPAEQELPVYSYSNPSVLVAGAPSSIGASLHYATETQVIEMAADITGQSNEGPFVVQITLPIAVGLPVVRQSNGQSIDEEIYLRTTIENGRMTASGTLPSGAWEISKDRVNAALKKINAQFELDLPNITFIITRGA